MESLVKTSIALSLALIIFLLDTPILAANSMAEAYVEQGKRAFDRGDLIAAKRLFNKAAVTSVRSSDDQLHMAAIFNNAGEAYRRIYELRGSSYEVDDDDIATAQWLRKIYPKEDFAPEELPGRPDWLALCFLNIAVEYKEKQLGSFSLDVSRSLENLAALNQALGRQDEAEALLRKAIQIHETKEGARALSIAPLCYRLGISLKVRADKHTDSQARIAALQDAITNFQRADKIWTGSQSSPELLCAADKNLSLALFDLFSENKDVQNLAKSEIYFDEAKNRYLRNQPSLKKSYEQFKSDPEVQTFMLQSFACRWKAVADLKKPDDSLPTSAADELVNLMKSAKRVDRMEDYKWAQAKYDQYCRPTKAKAK